MAAVLDYFCGKEHDDKDTDRECKRELRRIERHLKNERIELHHEVEAEKKRLQDVWEKLDPSAKELAVRQLLAKQDAVQKNVKSQLNLEAQKQFRKEIEDGNVTRRLWDISYTQMARNAAKTNPREVQARALKMARMKDNAAVERETILEAMENDPEDTPCTETTDPRVKDVIAQMDVALALKKSSQIPMAPSEPPTTRTSPHATTTDPGYDSETDVELGARLQNLIYN